MIELLPAVYRLRDGDDGPLRALLDVLQGQADVLDRDIEQLYDNWFVETCDPWVVPYIADLLRVRGLYDVAAGVASERAYVANTLSYRRRKGTVAVLEELAFDVTGWRAKAVEFFQLLQTTQYVKHLRLFEVVTPDLRDANGLDLLGGPFERAAHTAEVRRIPPARGRYNIPNVGLYLWRLDRYPVTRGTARQIGTGQFTFSPLGLDAPLFNDPQTRATAAIADLAQEQDVPAPLRRRALHDELEARRAALAAGEDPPETWFRAGREVLEVWLGPTKVPPEQLLVADLTLWQRPPATAAAAIDPQLGRLTLPAGATPDAVEVSYSYGFSGDLGGGPYDRTSLIDRDFASHVDWQRAVGREAGDVAGKTWTSLAKAIHDWNATGGQFGVIAILDSRTYDEALEPIEFAEGQELLIVAADWPAPQDVGHWAPLQRRPHVLADVQAKGTAPASSEAPGRLTLEGLLIEGSVTVLGGNLGALRLAHSTVVPSAGGLGVDPAGGDNARLDIELERAICGAIDLPASVATLTVHESIVDADPAVSAPGAAASLDGSTILGAVSILVLEASDSIFTEPVRAERRQLGCVRFSFVPRDPATRTPRRYRCQPDLALAGVLDPAEQAAIASRVVPTFTSATYGQPAYAQLAQTCPIEIRTGAEDGSEMGAFGFLKQPQREANLRTALDEYLRLGLEAGVFYVT